MPFIQVCLNEIANRNLMLYKIKNKIPQKSIALNSLLENYKINFDKK